MGEGRGLISMNKTSYSASACLLGWGWVGGGVELGISGRKGVIVLSAHH